jgi:hypothetical protein
VSGTSYTSIILLILALPNPFQIRKNLRNVSNVTVIDSRSNDKETQGKYLKKVEAPSLSWALVSQIC